MRISALARRIVLVGVGVAAVLAGLVAQPAGASGSTPLSIRVGMQSLVTAVRSTGTPSSPSGVQVYDHLHQLAAGSPTAPPPGPTAPPPSPPPTLQPPPPANPTPTVGQRAPLVPPATHKAALPRVSCVVPALRGDSLSRARALLKRHHCGVGRISRLGRGRLVVKSASAPAGRRLPADTKISLVLVSARH